MMSIEEVDNNLLFIMTRDKEAELFEEIANSIREYYQIGTPISMDEVINKMGGRL